MCVCDINVCVCDVILMCVCDININVCVCASGPEAGSGPVPSQAAGSGGSV